MTALLRCISLPSVVVTCRDFAQPCLLNDLNDVNRSVSRRFHTLADIHGKLAFNQTLHRFCLVVILGFFVNPNILRDDRGILSESLELTV